MEGMQPTFSQGSLSPHSMLTGHGASLIRSSGSGPPEYDMKSRNTCAAPGCMRAQYFRLKHICFCCCPSTTPVTCPLPWSRWPQQIPERGGTQPSSPCILLKDSPCMGRHLSAGGPPLFHLAEAGWGLYKEGESMHHGSHGEQEGRWVSRSTLPDVAICSMCLCCPMCDTLFPKPSANHPGLVLHSPLD